MILALRALALRKKHHDGVLSASCHLTLTVVSQHSVVIVVVKGLQRAAMLC